MIPVWPPGFDKDWYVLDRWIRLERHLNDYGIPGRPPESARNRNLAIAAGRDEWRTPVGLVGKFLGKKSDRKDQFCLILFQPQSDALGPRRPAITSCPKAAGPFSDSRVDR